MSELYYLQDSRFMVGNDLVWWAKDRMGYTSDISKARVFTKESATKHNQDRESDIPWPKDYIDARTRPVVDCQVVDISQALMGTDITLYVQPKPPRV